MLEELSNMFESSLGFWEALIPVIFSLGIAIIVYLLYRTFYASSHIGAGVNRTFLLGGPAITMLFLVIQSSVPLGLGLLGALSFIRFRTPIKDPAEVGYVLLLIAGAIGAATGNYLITFILLIIVTLALTGHRLMQNRSVSTSLSHMVVTINEDAFQMIESKLNAFFREQLPGFKVETISLVDGNVNMHYQYQRKASFDAVSFTRDLKGITGPSDVDVFIS